MMLNCNTQLDAHGQHHVATNTVVHYYLWYNGSLEMVSTESRGYTAALKCIHYTNVPMLSSFE